MTDVAAPVANLTHDDPIVRSQAARSLIKLGSAAQAAIPALIRALEDRVMRSLTLRRLP